MASRIADDNCSGQHAVSRVQPQTMSRDNHVWKSGYSPYGYHVLLKTVLGFNGGRQDPATGYYPLGNGRRSYSPSLMRFMGSDSLSPFALGGLNSYAYCIGDPINHLDPSGNYPFFKRRNTLITWVFPKKQKLPAAVYADARTEVLERFVSYRNVSKEYKMNLVEQADSVPSGYDLIGFHGSKEMHAQSLYNGVDTDRLKRDLLGKGFYASTNYEYANKYAGKDGRIFAVYGRGVERWREGVQFDRPASDILLIRPPTFSNIIVRSEIRMPLRVLQPIAGDSF